MKQCKINNKGFSLVNLLIIVAILATIIGYSTTSYDSSGAKSVQLYNDMSNISTALKQFKNDTGCFPHLLSSLMKKQYLDKNYCGRKDLETYWNGPYITGMGIKGEDIDYSYINGKNKFGDGGWSNYVISGPFTSDVMGTGTATTKQFVVAERVPSSIINKAMEICNKGYSDETHKTFKQGNCTIFGKGFSKYDSGISYSLDKIKEDTTDYSIGMLLEERRK